MYGPTAGVQTGITAAAVMPRAEATKIGLQPLATPGTEAAEAHVRQPGMEPVPARQGRTQVSRGARVSAPIKTALPVRASPEPTGQAGVAAPGISIAVQEGLIGVPVLQGPTDLLQGPQGATGVRVTEAAVRQEATGDSVAEAAVRHEAFGAVVAAVALQEDDPVEDPVEDPEDVEINVNSKVKN